MNPLKLGVGGDLPKIKNLNQKMCSKGPKIPFFGSHLSAFSHLSDPTELAKYADFRGVESFQNLTPTKLIRTETKL